MTAAPASELHTLYEADETAWLDAMAALAADGRTSEFDLPNLQEYLESMAIRDRREVLSRLEVLLLHLLKWECQPDHRTGSWKATIRTQRRELGRLCESGTLWNHAEACLAEGYAAALLDAADETGLDRSLFSAQCPWTLEQLLVENDG